MKDALSDSTVSVCVCIYACARCCGYSCRVDVFIIQQILHISVAQCYHNTEQTTEQESKYEE